LSRRRRLHRSTAYCAITSTRADDGFVWNVDNQALGNSCEGGQARWCRAYVSHSGGKPFICRRFVYTKYM